MIVLTDFTKTLARRWVRYGAQLLVGAYGLIILGGLGRALIQSPSTPSAALLRNHPYFAIVFLGGVGVHLVIVAILVVLSMRRDRFATILLGAWFVFVAPVVLALLFGFDGLWFVAAAVSCGAVSLGLWRYNKTQVNGHEIHQGARLPLNVGQGVIVVAAIALLVVALSLVRAYADAVGFIVFPMMLLWAWSIDDPTGFAGFIAPINGTIGIVCILWGVSARAIDWSNIVVGALWMATVAFMWWISIVLLRISGRRRKCGCESMI